jgi:Sec-independent protein secretion pathway component TatC
MRKVLVDACGGEGIRSTLCLESGEHEQHMHWTNLVLATLLANWQVTLVTAALLMALPIAAVNLWRRRKRIDAEALGEEAEKFATPAALYIIFFGAALLFYAGLAFALFRLAMFLLLR